MYRKNRFWNSILFKFSVRVLLLGLISILSISYIVREQMQHNIENQITEEVKSIQSNSKIYIRQILLLNNSTINEDGFKSCMYEIESQIRNSGNFEVTLYDMSGEPLRDDREINRKMAGEREDFAQALEGKSAFTVVYGQNKSCKVYFTMPVEIMNQKLGILSYYLDYDSIYQREWSTINSMFRVMMLAFGVIFLLVWVMMQHMVTPVRKLSRISSDVSGHLADGQIDSGLVEGFPYKDRKDEIGELSRNYAQMLKVTEEQFYKIGEDRDRILRLWNSRQEFYNNVTHELKTPLTTISGYAQLIEENGLSDEELFYSGMEHILQESTRLHRMVVQLLEMQNKESIADPEPVEITALLSEVTASMQMKARRYENRLVLKSEGTCVVLGKEDRIRQVFINLIDNAIKYGEPRKKILISVRRKEDNVQISVVNAGVLDEEEKQRIFEPFYRIDKERSRELGSSGLGLALVGKIMEEHGGTVRAESRDEGYVIFSVYFPVMERRRERGEDE